MEKFHIWDVISVLGLPGPVSGRSSYDIPCPVCDRGRRSRHLNINLHKEVYRCPKCGIYGGIFDLYALYTGVPRDKVRREMLDRLNWNQSSVPIQRKQSVIIPESREAKPAPVEVRHAVYTAMLNKLSLEPDHRENLRGRGLTDAEIEALEYKSTLTVGMNQIAGQLAEEGYALAGVPGFFRTDTGIWRFTVNIRGILIPVRNPSGQIQGLQVRLDNIKKRKFRWASSTDLKDGCRAESWVHLAGDPSEEILLTEGPMKADVIHALSGQTVLAVPGVNSLSHLEKALTELKEQGLKRIMTAFDMDMLTNPHVEKAYHALMMLLSGMGFSSGTYLWDCRYKGLDDYIWESLMRKRRKKCCSRKEQAMNNNKNGKKNIEPMRPSRLFDDGALYACLENNTVCTELVLRIILDNPELKVKSVKRRTLMNGDGWLDIHASDNKYYRNHIGIRLVQGDVSPKLARYYCSIMDAYALNPYEDSDQLSETFVIIVTERDVFGGNRPLYHINRQIDVTGEPFGSGEHIIYVENKKLKEDFIMLLGIGHGNYAIKTPSLDFVSGLSEHTVRPPMTDEIIEYKGKFWTLSGKRLSYMRDKTRDDRYFILTLFAIAKELYRRENYRSVEKIQLAVGLPPEHYGLLRDTFAEYFKNRGLIEFTYADKPYSLIIDQVMVYPQAYAAVVPNSSRILNTVRVFVEPRDLHGRREHPAKTVSGKLAAGIAGGVHRGLARERSRL